ncbi:hypothetical protein J5491_03670 [Candidatus Saccharibacteria bacterium]|nr:hypothetical protein [Candidatus Saccharibacteria bacterium]
MGFSSPVNHEHNYPDILVVREYVENLVSFLDKAYRVFLKKVEDDTSKNNALEPNQRNYSYKERYGSFFKVYIYTSAGGSSSYDSDSAFRSAVTDGRLNGVKDLSVSLEFCFGRGLEGAIEDHRDAFKISFQPYDIKFTRDSNFSDPEMDALEEQIVKLLEDFPSTKTIFSPES